MASIVRLNWNERVRREQFFLMATFFGYFPFFGFFTAVAQRGCLFLDF